VLCPSLVKERLRSLTVEVPEAPSIRSGFRQLDARLKLSLVAALAFSLGNSGDAFLVLRAKDLGLSTMLVVISYLVYNFVFMSTAFPAGLASDYFGRRVVFMAGLLIFTFVDGGLAIANEAAFIWPLFAIYGLYIALTDGVARALVSDLAPEEHRASALGLYGILTGIAALVASLVAGQLWDSVGEWAPFALGATGALASAALLGRAILRSGTEDGRA
jgi:MFS family permease